MCKHHRIIHRVIDVVLGLMVAISIAATLSGCGTMSMNGSNGDPTFSDLEAMLNRESGMNQQISIVVGHLYGDETNVGAYTLADDDTHIYVTPPMKRWYEQGIVTHSMMALIVGHELGHISHHGKATRGGPSEEIFSDYYGLLFIEEAKSDGYSINLREAISIWRLPQRSAPASASHPSSESRYQRLKEKLDQWERQGK